MRKFRSDIIPFVKIDIDDTVYTFVHPEDLEVSVISGHDNVRYDLLQRPNISYSGGWFYDYVGSSFTIVNSPTVGGAIFNEANGTWPVNRSKLYNCEISFFPESKTTPIFLGQARILNSSINMGVPQITFKVQPLNPIQFKFFSELAGDGITTIEDYTGARLPLLFTVGRFSRVPFTILESTSDTVLDNTAGASFDDGNSIIVYNNGKVYAVNSPKVDLVQGGSFALILKGSAITETSDSTDEDTTVTNLETAQGHITEDNNDGFFPSNIGSNSIYEVVPKGISIQDNWFPGSNGGNAWCLYTKQFTGDHDKEYGGSRTRAINEQSHRSTGIEVYDEVSVTSATGTVTGGVLRVVRNSGTSGVFAQGQQITFRSDVGLFEDGKSYNIDNVNGTTFDLPLDDTDTLTGATDFDYSFNAYGGIDTNQIIGFERVGATPNSGSDRSTSYTGTTTESKTGDYTVTYSNYNGQSDPSVSEVGYTSSVQGTNYDFPNSSGLGWALIPPPGSPGLTAKWSPTPFQETHVHQIPSYSHSLANHNTGDFDTVLNSTYTSELTADISLDEELYYYTFAKSSWVLSVPNSSISITRAENKINPDVPSSEFSALKDALFNYSTSTTGDFTTSGIGTIDYGSRSVGIQILAVRIVNDRVFFVTNSPVDLPDFDSMTYQYLSVAPVGDHSIPNADQTHTINISVTNSSAESYFVALIEPKNTGRDLKRSFYDDAVSAPTVSFDMTGQCYARSYGTTTGGGLNSNGQNRTNHTRTQSGSIPGVSKTYKAELDADAVVYSARDYDERTIDGSFKLSSKNLNTLITEDEDTIIVSGLGFDELGEVTVDGISKIIEEGTIDNILQYIADQLESIQYELFPNDPIVKVEPDYDDNAELIKNFEVLNRGFTEVQTFKEVLEALAVPFGLQFGYEFFRDEDGDINMIIRCNFAHGAIGTPVKVLKVDNYAENQSPTQNQIPQVLLAYTNINIREGDNTAEKEIVVQFGYDNFPNETDLDDPIGGDTIRVDHSNTRYTSVNQSDEMRTLLQGKFEALGRPTDKIVDPSFDLSIKHGDIIEVDMETLGHTETHRIIGISSIDSEQKQITYVVEVIKTEALKKRR